MSKQLILVLDFGGQVNQLVARRIREHDVYCQVMPFKTSAEKIRELNPIGIIFTGGCNDISLVNAPKISKDIFELNIPILAIGYGAQLIVNLFGGNVDNETSEHGNVSAEFFNSKLFDGITSSNVWTDHKGSIVNLPEGFIKTASTQNCSVAAFEDTERKIYGLQFNPEIKHTENGFKILGNFLFNICGCSGDWTMKEYAQSQIEEIRNKIGNGKVLLALSGGVDSSVCCALLSKAIGNQLTCIFVDHGFMRKNEADEVEAAFKNWNLNFIRIDGEQRFLSKLKGVSEPEKKRKIIGEEFIRVFEEEAKKIGKVDFLCQGTIYPDVIESGIHDFDGGVKKTAVIKSHHNVGGLPDYVDFKEIIEPLRWLFKDEVRKLGLELGLPDTLVWRQPFPGPGLAIRVIGELVKEKLDILRDADYIFREEIANAGLNKQINQYFAVLTNMRSVGVSGDDRTYDYTLALRGVITTDFMTAEFAKIPYDVLEKASIRIVNEVKNINRVVYDITSKPPATIEWE